MWRGRERSDIPGDVFWVASFHSFSRDMNGLPLVHMPAKKTLIHPMVQDQGSKRLNSVPGLGAMVKKQGQLLPHRSMAVPSNLGLRIDRGVCRKHGNLSLKPSNTFETNCDVIPAKDENDHSFCNHWGGKHQKTIHEEPPPSKNTSRKKNKQGCVPACRKTKQNKERNPSCQSNMIHYNQKNLQTQHLQTPTADTHKHVGHRQALSALATGSAPRSRVRVFAPWPPQPQKVAFTSAVTTKKRSPIK